MKKGFYISMISVALAIVILAGFSLFLKNKTEDRQRKELAARHYDSTVGTVKSCTTNPSFPFSYGLKPPFLIDLRQKGYRGLRILENQKDGKVLQLPGWSAFGWLGLYTLDHSGNIYISSVPHESIEHNPLGEQNRILKVDNKTGELFEFMQLPQAKASTLKNPFGAIGLHYDCDNGFLYVTSLAGSNRQEELGRIYQIDLERKIILSQLDNVDALGIGTFNTVDGKRLYFGLARKSEVYSVSLDETGKIGDDVRFEFSLVDQPGGSFDKAHRFRFKNDQMEIKANEFAYTLAAASDPERNIYNFKYNRITDKWEFIDVHMQDQ